MTNREKLTALIAQLTGQKGQSELLKQALRYARGALKSTLASEREIAEHIDSLSRIGGIQNV